ncbi:hypothetical protein BKA61DRAFT_569185 [Leptodontidium sp. MPI-SDFR-AT-0119]|nr:hypothetical protein BKA61DRAFT_569185 [Leptodontidium sp. MPI-SDFR-AT-0119]
MELALYRPPSEDHKLVLGEGLIYWYASGTDESDTNAFGIQKISELPTTVGDCRESTGNGQTDSPSGDGRSRDGKPVRSTQSTKLPSDLGHMPMDEVVQGTSAQWKTWKRCE